jgi:hypothetical protein
LSREVLDELVDYPVGLLPHVESIVPQDVLWRAVLLRDMSAIQYMW